MANKAIVFIVEGKTDKKALESVFKKIYRKNKITFFFTSGDITSDDTINIGNVEDEIYKYIDNYIRDNKLRKTDISRIVHLFDTDGTYIDEKFIENGDTKEFYYSTKNIKCIYPERVKARNRHKKEIMDFLLKKSDINKIEYECYYMSSNLDHALYNKQNMTEEEKIEAAEKFYEFFVGKEKAFISFLVSDVVNGAPDSYKPSWKYIKEELHSLERHTNLNLYFKNHPLF